MSEELQQIEQGLRNTLVGLGFTENLDRTEFNLDLGPMEDFSHKVLELSEGCRNETLKDVCVDSINSMAGNEDWNKDVEFKLDVYSREENLVVIHAMINVPSYVNKYQK